MSKTNETSKLLTDSELDVVSGGFFADYVKQLLANSEPGRGSCCESALPRLPSRVGAAALRRPPFAGRLPARQDNLPIAFCGSWRHP